MQNHSVALCFQRKSGWSNHFANPGLRDELDLGWYYDQTEHRSGRIVSCRRLDSHCVGFDSADNFDVLALGLGPTEDLAAPRVVIEVAARSSAFEVVESLWAIGEAVHPAGGKEAASLAGNRPALAVDGQTARLVVIEPAACLDATVWAAESGLAVLPAVPGLAGQSE